MAGPDGGRYRRAVPSDAVIARVLGAARAAAGNQGAAEAATVRAFAGGGDAEHVAATAVRLALQAAPAAAFAAMCPQDAEAVALARLLRLPEGRIAALLGVPQAEVRRRLTRGLTTTLPALARAA